MQILVYMSSPYKENINIVNINRLKNSVRHLLNLEMTP